MRIRNFIVRQIRQGRYNFVLSILLICKRIVFIITNIILRSKLLVFPLIIIAILVILYFNIFAFNVRVLIIYRLPTRVNPILRMTAVDALTPYPIELIELLWGYIFKVRMKVGTFFSDSKEKDILNNKSLG